MGIRLRVLLAFGALLSAPLMKAAHAQTERIAAVVNGAVISQADVQNREKLFALSTGLPMSKAVLDRLGPQVTRQLIDEKLRLQEEQKQHIIVTDQQVADAIKEIEQRNGMPPGGLRAKLAGQGVALRTLIDQIRVQIGWTQLLRDKLRSTAEITDADIEDRLRQLKTEIGQTEYEVSEIFIPVEDTRQETDAQNFANTVITELRAGAPFAVVAAQFSQSQTALQGGDLGWVAPDEVDPAVAQILSQMPVGAVSNPIRVPGGYSVVTLRGKRQLGNSMATVLSVRQAFLPFSTTLDPQHPTDQQRQTLLKAQQLSRTAKSCDAIAAANQAGGNKHPADPGPVNLDNVPNPKLRAILASLPVGQASKPLVANDGILVMMVCSREQQNVGMPTKDEVRHQLLAERVELESRQLMSDLRRRAIIQHFSNT